jgi:hypothetical protein
VDLIGQAAPLTQIKLIFCLSRIDRVFINKYIKILIQELQQGAAMLCFYCTIYRQDLQQIRELQRFAQKTIKKSFHRIANRQ